MRILLLTDSLGCPRPGTDVSLIWTDKILCRWSSNVNVIYTYCKHGLSAKMIDVEYIQEIAPNIIIAEFGIVDACRRALKRWEMSIISHIPGIDKQVKKFCSKHHYNLSSKRNIHHCNLDEFQNIVRAISKIPQEFYFISIAPAGQEMREKAYNVDKDIVDYNNSVKMIDGVHWINPFEGIEASTFLLEDGHHLNAVGHSIVFDFINNILKEKIGVYHE